MDNQLLKQSIRLTGVDNARELGGYISADGRTVRDGVLLRTGKLSSATESDLDRLSKVYHVGKIIDMRSEPEINGSPDITVFTRNPVKAYDLIPEGAEYINLPVMDLMRIISDNKRLVNNLSAEQLNDPFYMVDVLVENKLLGDELYYSFLESDMGKNSYSRFFRELLTLPEGKAFLFHCTQGKDRTGIGALLILTVLGVDEETIIEDYMLSNSYNNDKIEKRRAQLEKISTLSHDRIDKYIMAIESVKRSTMTGIIARLKSKYTSVTNYIITELGVSQSEIEFLRSRFLTDNA